MSTPDTLAEVLALAGLVIFALTSLAAVLVSLLVSPHNLFYLGTQLVLLGVALRMSSAWINSDCKLVDVFPDKCGLLMFADTLSLLALAFAVDMGLRVHVWQRVLLKSGRQAAPPLLVGAVRFFTYMLGVLAIVQFAFNQSVAALATVSGAMAVILGLSAQSTLGEMFAGIAIALSRPLRIGDWVKIGELDAGRVADMTWRLVRIETSDMNTINVTNRVVADSRIRNFSETNTVVRIKADGVVSPAQDIQEKQKSLEEEMSRVPAVVNDPEPTALYRSTKDGRLEFSLRYYVHDNDTQDTATERVWQEVRARLTAAGLFEDDPSRRVVEPRPGAPFDDASPGAA